MPSLNTETFCERTEIASEVHLKMLFFCKKLFRWVIPGVSKIRDIFWVSTWLLLSRCPRGLRRRSAAARLLRLWFRIPPGAWMFVSCECFVLSGRGLCDELITPPEESYRLWCVVVCDLEMSWMRRPWPTGGLSRQKQMNEQTNKQTNLTLVG
jgi:hypothetical protein